MIKKLGEFAQAMVAAAKSPKTKETLAKTKAILLDLFSKEKRVKIGKYNGSRRQFIATLALAGGLALVSKKVFFSDSKKPRENSADNPSFVHNFIDKDIIDKLPKTGNDEFDNFWSNPEYFANIGEPVRYDIIWEDDGSINKVFCLEDHPNLEDEKKIHTDGRKKLFIKQDAWLNFLVTQESQLENTNLNKGDQNLKQSIIDDLAKLPEFEYLVKDPIYKGNDKLRSFNTLNSQIPIDASLPIPIQTELRKFDDEYFTQCAELGIQTLLKHNIYGPKIQEHVDRIGVSEFAKNLTAFAKTETAPKGGYIGFYEFHRYEAHRKSYSYSPFHVLMEKGCEGYDAANVLGISEGQTYHPFFASILACVYLCNKTISESGAIKRCKKTKKLGRENIPLINFFPISEETKDIIAYLYNGKNYKTTGNNYDQRLLDNLNSL